MASHKGCILTLNIAWDCSLLTMLCFIALCNNYLAAGPDQPSFPNAHGNTQLALPWRAAGSPGALVGGGGGRGLQESPRGWSACSALGGGGAGACWGGGAWGGGGCVLRLVGPRG